jgi:hypothetical protein
MQHPNLPVNGERQKGSSNRGSRIPSVQTAIRPTGKQEQQQHENNKSVNMQEASMNQ